MTILNDKQIEDFCDVQKMIEPFSRRQVREVDGKRVISYGLSSFGYDARVADEFRQCVEMETASEALFDAYDDGKRSATEVAIEVFHALTIDPKRIDERLLHQDKQLSRNADGSVTLNPHSFTLARTVEYFRIPDDVMVICLGKSTYARCGLIVNVTPLEPGWEGNVTLELSNTTPLPIKVYPNEGIAQFVFFRGERPAVTYGDRAGKYQGQTGITVAKL